MKTRTSNPRHFRSTLKNFDVEEYEGDNGKTKVKTFGRESHEIWADLKNMTGDYIKRVGDRVFANGGGKIIYLAKSDALFGWLASRGVHSEWGKSRDMVAKSEFLNYIGNVAECYDYATELPHYPCAKGFYYVQKIAPKQTGRLDELVDFFAPDTGKDRALIKAAFVTPFWGKGFGRRPGFLIVAREDDEKQGKGTGKSTLSEIVGYLAGGFVDLSKKSEDEPIRKALLSSNMRVARYDNVKGGVFSSETLESIMTSPTLTAHKLYTGTVAVPNVYTFFITFNDAELSSDMAQRCVSIRIKRSKPDSDWFTNITGFIDKYREEIIADIGNLILMETSTQKLVTRFPEWEREIMHKCATQQELLVMQTSMIEDQTAVNEENNLREEFASHCSEKIAQCIGRDPNGSTYAIRRAWVVKWFIEFRDRKMSRKFASKMLKRILPIGFSPDTRELDGIDHLIYSGPWARGEDGFTPSSANCLFFEHSEIRFREWKFSSPMPKRTMIDLSKDVDHLDLRL